MAANFQHMGNAGGNQMMMQQQPGQPGAQMQGQLQNVLLTSIQQQTGVLAGWQATVPVQDRLGQVWHVVTQLRLANTGQHDLQKICGMALQFEKQSFDNAPDRDTYLKMLRDKLEQLTLTRNRMSMNAQAQLQQLQNQQQPQSVAHAQQMAMMNQGGMAGQMPRANMGQPQPHQGFQHLQHQMQASPLPPQPQQQVPMGMGIPPNMGQSNPQFQMAMQQQQQQQQQGQPHPQMQQIPQQPQPGPGNRPQNPTSGFSQQEQAMIVELTNRYMNNATEEDKNNIRIQMQGRMDQATIARYQQQGVDPLLMFYRQQAINRMRQEKQRQQQALANQQGQGMPVNTSRNPGAIPMQQQRSANSMMNAPGQQPQQMLGASDFGFLGAIDNNANQQQQAGLPQENGQMIVPGGIPRGNTTPQPIAGLPAQVITPNGQRQVQNPNFRAQQQLNAQQQVQDRMNQAQQAQIRANANAKAQQIALQGQPGGMGPMPPQQSPAMSTLTAPLQAPQKNSLQAQQMSQNQSQNQFGQPLDPRFGQMNQRAANNTQINPNIFPPNMTQEQRQKLATLPQDKLNEVLGKWNERNNGQQMKSAGPMPGNGQMPRVNQGVPQAAFAQGNMANQMASQFLPNGQPVQRQPQAMMGGMNPQQQLLLQQQMGRMPAQQAQGMPGQFQNIDPQAISQIDNMDFPPSIITMGNPNMPQQVPPDVKKWAQLKQFVIQNGGPNAANMLEQVKIYQRAHFSNLLRARNLQQQNHQERMRQMQANANQNRQPMGQPQGQPMLNPGMAAPVAPMGQPQMQNSANRIPVSMTQVGPADIQKAREHPSGKWANMTDDQIRTMIMKTAYIQQSKQRQMQALMAQQAQQQQQQQQQLAGPMQQIQGMRPHVPPNAAQLSAGIQQGQVAQAAAAAIKKPQAALTANAPVARPQQQPPSQDVKATGAAANRPAKTNQGRQGQPTSSPPQPAKSLKRASSDEVMEVPNPNTQQAARTNQQQRGAQVPRPPLTNQQPASLSPEQRKEYIARAPQAKAQGGQSVVQATAADTSKVNQIKQEEAVKSAAEPFVELKMTPENLAVIQGKLINTTPKVINVGKVAARWFALTHDENRLRLFYKTQNKIMKQFDGDNATKLKSAFSITIKEVDDAYNLAQTMISDVLAKYPAFAKGGATMSGQPAANNAAAQPAESPNIPLNAANLQQQQNALKQQSQNKMHNRSNSRTSHTPAAPTSAHPPPFPIGSPHGTPVKYGDAGLTRDNLKLPPNKKAKHNITSTPHQNQQNAATGGTHGKAKSPEQAKQPVAKPESAKEMPVVYHCTETDCDHYYNDPFPTDEELQKHKQQEHRLPLEDPTKFLLNELSTMIGLNPDGTPKKTEPASGASQDSKAAKPESTPMDRQHSTMSKPSPAASKSSKLQRSGDAKDTPVSGKQESNSKESQPPAKQEATLDLWASSLVNPQDLMHNFQKFETGAGGAISNMDVYRSITPNDTPESSKDGVSEPNSDISDGVDLNIDLSFDANWMPFGLGDADDLLDLGNFTVSGSNDDTIMVDTETLNSNNNLWDEFMDPTAFDANGANKSFTFDTSMFSMNEEAGDTDFALDFGN